jgi:signal transduction histidine kinase
LLKKDTLLNLTGYSAKVGGWEFDTETLEQTWTDEVYRIHEIDYPFEPTVNNGIGFYAGNSRKAIEKAVRHAVECGAPFDLELEFITAKGNHRWVHSIGKALLEDGKVTKVYGSIQDITDQKLADNEVHRLNENLELLVAERTRNLEIAYQELIFHLNEIEQFTYISNHDLQEPLRTISLYSQLLKEEFSDKLGQDGKQYIDFMHNSATRMKAMVKGLFDYSLVGTTGEIKIVDCKMLFESVLSGLQFAINESQAEITICSLPTISCFEAELSMLFQNLLSNAIKFHRPDNRPLIEVSARELETEWLFSVNDNGIGIDEKYAEKIFIIFQRLHNRNEYTGTGIGLAQCKKIVKLHGGRIWVESQVGKGSTFMFTIPKKLSVVNFQHQLSQNIHAPGS